MCSTPKMPPPPVAPPRYAAQKTPDRTSAKSAGERMSDSVRAAQSTILTSPSGTMQSADTSKKTLLGA